MNQSTNKSISNDMTVKDLQGYVWQMNIDREFDLEDPSKKLVMLVEEVGELAKSIRKKVGMKFTDTTKQTDIEEELADVQIVLLGLASMLEVDMITAVQEKEAKNQKRVWK
jgi:NTP pyrophosphatase (non-canonical NTP hydrolase)